MVAQDEDLTDAERAENTCDQDKAGLLQRMGKDLPHKLHQGVRENEGSLKTAQELSV